jgi:large subunit ribosomal protein L4
LNQKLRLLARRSALSIKASENNIKIIDQLVFENPRTKDFVGVLDR